MAGISGNEIESPPTNGRQLIRGASRTHSVPSTLRLVTCTLSGATLPYTSGPRTLNAMLGSPRQRTFAITISSPCDATPVCLLSPRSAEPPTTTVCMLTTSGATVPSVKVSSPILEIPVGRSSSSMGSRSAPVSVSTVQSSVPHSAASSAESHSTRSASPKSRNELSGARCRGR